MWLGSSAPAVLSVLTIGARDRSNVFGEGERGLGLLALVAAFLSIVSGRP
jgi:hypothetical protein